VRRCCRSPSSTSRGWNRSTSSFAGPKISLRGEGSEQALEKLGAQREAIEGEIGAPLQWNPFPEKRTKTINLVRPCDVTDRVAWPEAIEWLTKMALAFRAAFVARIADLDRKSAKSPPAPAST
jgi:hypothetical protein